MSSDLERAGYNFSNVKLLSKFSGYFTRVQQTFQINIERFYHQPIYAVISQPCSLYMLVLSYFMQYFTMIEDSVIYSSVQYCVF